MNLAHSLARFAAAGNTLRNLRRDFVEWHDGRPRYALWAVDVDLPPVAARVAAAAGHLGGLLLDGYRRQPHVTLALCGFPQAVPWRRDDYGPAALAAQLAGLRAAGGPFRIVVGGLSSFASAPFLGVADLDGGLARLRAGLAADDTEHPHGYVPHVTVGLYAGSWPTAQVLPRLGAFGEAAALVVRVERLGLMSYCARDIGGPLALAAEFDLAAGRLRVHDRAAFGEGFFAAAGVAADGTQAA